MAREVKIFSDSYIAAADLSSSQFCAVVTDTAGKAALPGSTGLLATGILQDKPTAGQVGEVLILGKSKGLVGTGGVTMGDHVTALTTTGRIVTAATGNYILGIAQDTAAAGEYTTVLLLPGGISA